MRTSPPDMVMMKILDSTMVSICREMGILLMKTSYSTIFNEGLDFTCALADTKGDMIACAEFCPTMIGGMPLLIKTCAQEIPFETIAGMLHLTKGRVSQIHKQGLLRLRGLVGERADWSASF